MFAPVWDWINNHPSATQVIVIAALVVSVGSLVGVPLLIARLPADYFVDEEAPPAAHLVTRVLKNLVGLVFVLAGIAMLVLPGQGLLSIFAGMLLVDFPGKRRLERALVARPRVRRGLDWVRARAGAPPLEPPDPGPLHS